jgi:hypothetical protein
LANIFLHYVLDEWFEMEVRPRLKGPAFLIRYADDFIIGVAREDDARRIMEVLPKRMSKYGLTVHPEKTRLVRFDPPQTENSETEERLPPAPGCGQILWRIWGIWGILKNLLTVLLTDATLKEVMMYPRDIRVNDPSEALIVEQALAMYREMKQAADAAPDGTVFDTAESLAVARGRELMRRSLEIVLHDQAEGVEKKGLPAEPARVAARDITGVRGRARSSRRRVR